MPEHKIKQWNSKYSIIEDLIEAKEKILKNAGVYVCAPYVTGIINYDEVKQILKEYNCTYDDRQHTYGRMISNVIDKENKLDKYLGLKSILQLHGAMLFVDEINTV